MQNPNWSENFSQYSEFYHGFGNASEFTAKDSRIGGHNRIDWMFRPFSMTSKDMPALPTSGSSRTPDRAVDLAIDHPECAQALSELHREENRLTEAEKKNAPSFCDVWRGISERTETPCCTACIIRIIQRIAVINPCRGLLLRLCSEWLTTGTKKTASSIDPDADDLLSAN